MSSQWGCGFPGRLECCLCISSPAYGLWGITLLLFAQLLSNITLKHYMHNYVQLYEMNLFYLMLILQGLCIFSYRKSCTEQQMVKHSVCQLINLNVLACYIFFSIYLYISQSKASARFWSRRTRVLNFTCLYHPLVWWWDLEAGGHVAWSHNISFFVLRSVPVPPGHHLSEALLWHCSVLCSSILPVSHLTRWSWLCCGWAGCVHCLQWF